MNSTVVYIEPTFIDNFLLTYILLITSYHLIKFNYKKKCVFFACFFSAFLTLVFPLFSINGIWLFLCKLSVGYIITFISGFSLRLMEHVKLYFTFLVVTCLYAGIYFALNFAIFEVFNIKFIPIGLFALIVFVFAKLTLKTLKKYAEPILSNNGYECKISFGNKQLRLNAFLDTGNMLCDSNTNLPIIILQAPYIKQVLKNEQYVALLSCQNIDNLFDNIHYVSYSTIACSKQMIVFKPKEVVLEIKGKKEKVDCVVGVSTNKLFSNHNYQVIIGQSVLGGKYVFN